MTLYLPGVFTEQTLVESYRMRGWTASCGCHGCSWKPGQFIYIAPPGWRCDPSWTENPTCCGSHGGLWDSIMTEIQLIANYHTEVTFVSSPPGAQIFIDGAEWWPGATTAADGATFRGIPPASSPTPHTYEMRLAGHTSAKGTFELVEEVPIIITATLTLLVPTIINTIPIGARIILDGVDTLAVTNTTINLDQGSYTLTLSYPCYEDMIETVNAVSGDVVTISRALTKNTGDNLSILSTPPGASVYIGGVLQPATTPTSSTCVTEGTYQYVISIPGYQAYRGSYDIVRSTSTTIDAPLLLFGSEGTGSIDIRSNPTGASIFLDGIDKSVVTPSILTNIPVGSHTIVLTKTGYATAEKTITVSQDTTESVQMTLYSEGFLSFESIPPGAEIFLALTGQTPEDQGIVTPATISLPIGSYDYILRLDGYNDISGTADVTQGVTTPVTVDLIPSEGCVSFSTDLPGASIIIDGTLQEGITTPAIICGLTVGPHTYELALIGYQTVTGDITLTTGHGETVSTPLVSCTQNWVCRQPLDGYEHDTNNCGTSDRLNSICNAIPIEEEGIGGIGMLLVASLAFGAIMTSSNKGSKTRKLEQTYKKTI